MMRLKSYIAEKVNDTNRLKHLSHLEDLIFEEGAVGLSDAIESIDIYTDIFHSRGTGRAQFTMKWDGSPSVIIHNSANDYWVASKSAFNKDPKLNRTEADIKANHGHAPGLVEKLTYALKYCKNLGITGTVQGDFLYTDKDLTAAEINGERLVTFTPNTITYAVPVDSPLGRKILSTKMGIIFHTSYSGNDPKTMRATVGTYSVARLRNSREVFYDDALISKDATSQLSLDQRELTRIEGIKGRLTQLQKILPAGFLNELANHESLSKLMAQYNNAKVRAGEHGSVSVVNGFVGFIKDKWQIAIDKVKRDATKQAKANLRDADVQWVMNNMEKLKFAYEAFTLLNEAKLLIVNKLNRLSTMRTFVQRGNSMVAVAPEGFVAVQDNRVVKLVDRLEFSRNNFLGKG